MDPHQNPTASINSIGSSVEPELNLPISESTIDRLPNELIQLIFAKLELDRDVKKLIRLRLVSTRWKAMVEDYCQMKKSLIVALKQMTVSSNGIYFLQIEKQFFGFANKNDFSCLRLSTEIPSQCLSSLMNLFSNIVQLSIHCFEQSRVRDFSLYINSLASLAQLDLVGPFAPALSDLSVAALSKLEHLSFESNDSIYLKDNDHRQLVAHLGPGCVRVYLDLTHLTYHRISQWASINPNWLANLTHLRMCIYDEDECEKLVKFLSEHSTLLKLLNLHFIDESYLGSPLKITPSVIRDLARLTNLTELKLWNTKIKVSDFEHSATLTTLSSVLTSKLYVSDGNLISGDRFTRVLSVIFPNLVKLHLNLDSESNFSPIEQLQLEIEQHLDRFPNLQEHKIVV